MRLLGVSGVCLVLTAAVLGCSVPEKDTDPSSQIAQLTPYLSATFSPSPNPVVSITPEPPFPTPTPTQFVFTVKDELGWSIASRFGVTLAQLQSANPGVDLNFLKPGQTLIIPPAVPTPGAMLSPTPFLLSVQQPECYAAGGAGAWCVAVIANNTNTPVESVSAEILISGGSQVQGKVNILPLDLLNPGKSLPLIVHFDGPVPYPFDSMIRIMTALPISNPDERYAPLTAATPKVDIKANLIAADVSGTIDLGIEQVSTVRVVAVAWHADRVVGYRVWEYEGGTGVTGQITYDLTVYSVGPFIERVEIAAEAIR